MQRARDYLRSADTYDLKRLLSSLSYCPACNFVERIVEGDRHWWVGWVLEYARADFSIRRQDFEFAASLFGSVLRGYRCDYPLSGNLHRGHNFEFPLRPQDEDWLRMAVWKPDELEFMLLFLQSLGEGEPSPGVSALNHYDPAKDVDEASLREWWVREIRNCFTRVETFGMQRPYAVSFIG